MLAPPMLPMLPMPMFTFGVGGPLDGPTPGSSDMIIFFGRLTAFKDETDPRICCFVYNVGPSIRANAIVLPPIALPKYVRVRVLECECRMDRGIEIKMTTDNNYFVNKIQANTY